MVLVKSGKVSNVNLETNKTFIYISRKNSGTNTGIDWKNKDIIHWESYRIKETDMRTKTATFTTPNYFDLTTGVYCVLISSVEHENFSGIIIKVDYDEDKGLYTYQCQDWSREYQAKFELIIPNFKITTYQVINYLLTRGGVKPQKANAYTKHGKWKKQLSGLRPLAMYDQGFWNNGVKFNPMKQSNKMIIRNKSFIEATRDLIYGSGAYIDLHFDDCGHLQVEPFSKNDWLSGGLWLTTKENASRNFTFDTTNVITGVVVNGTDTKNGKFFSSKTLIRLDLEVFFGILSSSIENPNQKNKNVTIKGDKKVTSKKSNSKVNVNPYGTKKKVVYLNIDNINGYTSDMKKMKDMKNLLKKQGWEVHIMGVGPSTHYARRGEVKKGIWFCLYGGVCAGTLKEHCTSSWFLNPLKKNKSRVVVGFFPPSGDIRKGGRYYKWLCRAHDDNFSPSSFRGISYPSSWMSRNGIPFMYAKNAKEMVTKFLNGGDNYDKYDGGWIKHNVKWIK